MARTNAYTHSGVAVTSFTSGPLPVGSFTEAIVDVIVTAATGGISHIDGDNFGIFFTLSRVTPINSRLIPIGSVGVSGEWVNGSIMWQGGANYSWISVTEGMGINVQLDMVNFSNMAVTFDISIVGN